MVQQTIDSSPFASFVYENIKCDESGLLSRGFNLDTLKNDADPFRFRVSVNVETSNSCGGAPLPSKFCSAATLRLKLLAGKNGGAVWNLHTALRFSLELINGPRLSPRDSRSRQPETFAHYVDIMRTKCYPAPQIKKIPRFIYIFSGTPLTHIMGIGIMGPQRRDRVHR